MRHLVHQHLGIAAGGVEEHQIGGRVVEEGTEQAGGPEVHDGNGLAVGSRDGVHDGGKRTIGTGLEHGDDRRDGEKDAGKELGHFLHRPPAKLVVGMNGRRRDAQRQDDDRQQADVTHQIGQAHLGAVHMEMHGRFPQATHKHQADDHAQQQHIGPALHADGFGVGRGIVRQHALLAVEPAVEQEKERQQQGHGQGHVGPEVGEGPAEFHPLQKAQKQWWITQRREHTTDVGHQEDEEDDDVGLVLAVVVGTDQRADEQHGGPGGTHEAGQDGAEQQHARIQDGAAVQVAADVNAPGTGIEGREQQNERNVFGHGCMHERMQRRIAPMEPRKRDEKAQRPGQGDLAEVVMPDPGDGQRHQRDGQQNARKRNAPVDGHAGTIQRALGRPGGRGEQKQRQQQEVFEAHGSRCRGSRLQDGIRFVNGSSYTDMATR